MDILTNKFTATNLHLDEVMVYETTSNTNIQVEFDDITNKFTKLPEYIVFFSPSGVKAMEDILESLPAKLIKVGLNAVYQYLEFILYFR